MLTRLLMTGLALAMLSCEPTPTATSTTARAPVATTAPSPTRADRPLSASATAATLPTLIPTAAAALPATAIAATVIDVIDGDTIDVLIEGRTYRVRYIGIDTPETVHPTRGVEAYGIEASNRNKELVAGKTVYLEKDVSEVDRYGRLLRYVWLDGETMVNALLVAQGFAQVTTYPPDVKHADRFLALQGQAKSAGVGLWSAVNIGGTVAVTVARATVTPPGLPVQPLVATATPTRTPTPTSSSQRCHPSYPTVCIPPPPPDLDCGGISHRRFKVIPPDPHRFDGDRDGIGCES